MRKLKPKEVKSLIHGCTASKWRRQDSDPSLTDCKFLWCSTRRPCLMIQSR